MMTPNSEDLDASVREFAWTRSSAQVAGGDKEFIRLSPSTVHVSEGMASRSHTVYESVRESMRVVGQLVPIIVTADTNVLLDGVTRLEVAKK